VSKWCKARGWESRKKCVPFSPKKSCILGELTTQSTLEKEAMLHGYAGQKLPQATARKFVCTFWVCAVAARTNERA